MPELPGFTRSSQSLCGHVHCGCKGTLSKDIIAPVYKVEQICQDKSYLSSAVDKDQQLKIQTKTKKSSILSLLQMIWELPHEPHQGIRYCQSEWEIIAFAWFQANGAYM